MPLCHGHPLIRDPGGRITGHIEEKRFEPRYIRATDGRILAADDRAGSAPMRIHGTDGHIFRQID